MKSTKDRSLYYSLRIAVVVLVLSGGVDSVMAVYNEHTAEAPDWKLLKVDKGGHAFLFDPQEGLKMVKTVIEQLIR
ncbi:hypothetical protein [Chitinophaga varians]|uniref:hypothetical protein n=1 Tax=Chitinophaga varians TaxID=2202339 RepID=UPI00165F0341|nr:hypothetical protein [Chitinophaga varians]MBC9909389.1 hypothetical protein [Chitinophaga varians]